MTRIAIAGGPKTGKTTLATAKSAVGGLWQSMHEITGVPWHGPDTYAVVRHTDDLIGAHDWSQASAEVATWFDDPGPWIIEGVAVSRALRKWHAAHPGEPPPVDRVIYLEEAYVRLSKGQSAMSSGVETVHREIEPWLVRHGVRTERWRASQYSTHVEVVT